MTVWLSPEILRRVREAAAKRGLRMSQYIEYVLSVHFQLVDRGLWGVAEAMASGGVVNQVNINNFNIGTLIERLERIEQLIAAQSAVVVRIKMSESERAVLKDVINTVVGYAKTLAVKRPEEVASAVVLSLPYLERTLRKLLDVAKSVERRGITLEDLANSRSPDADLARRAVEALQFVQLAVEAAKADREKRVALANQLIAVARQLVHVN